jgi:hypothetical protein
MSRYSSLSTGPVSAKPLLSRLSWPTFSSMVISARTESTFSGCLSSVNRTGESLLRVTL